MDDYGVIFFGSDVGGIADFQGFGTVADRLVPGLCQGGDASDDSRSAANDAGTNGGELGIPDGELGGVRLVLFEEGVALAEDGVVLLQNVGVDGF